MRVSGLGSRRGLVPPKNFQYEQVDVVLTSSAKPKVAGLHCCATPLRRLAPCLATPANMPTPKRGTDKLPGALQITNLAHLALHIPASKLSLALAKLRVSSCFLGSLWLPTSEDPLLRPMASCCLAPALRILRHWAQLNPCCGAEQVPFLNICRYSSGAVAAPPPHLQILGLGLCGRFLRLCLRDFERGVGGMLDPPPSLAPPKQATPLHPPHPTPHRPSYHPPPPPQTLNCSVV